MDQGLHIGILENDFGAINVDMLMLHELRGDQCELKRSPEDVMRRATEDVSARS